MPKKKCHAFPTIFIIVLISCSEFVLAELGGAGGLVSQFATEFSDTGSQVLLDGREVHDDSWGTELLDEDAAANSSSVFNGGLRSASSNLSELDRDSVYEEAWNGLGGQLPQVHERPDKDEEEEEEDDSGYDTALEEQEDEEEDEFFECEEHDVLEDFDESPDPSEESQADPYGVKEEQDLVFEDLLYEEVDTLTPSDSGGYPLSASIITTEFQNKEWFGSDWDPILSLTELEDIKFLIAVDGGGTLTKIIYWPCPKTYILGLCCGLVPRDWFLDRFLINTEQYSMGYIDSIQDTLRKGFLLRLKDRSVERQPKPGFSVPVYPKVPVGSQSPRPKLPVTGGLAAQLKSENCALRNFIWQQDEVKSLAAGLALFMQWNDMREYSVKGSRFPLEPKAPARLTRALYVDMGERKPFISQIDDDRGPTDQTEMNVDNRGAHRTLSRKGIDATTFAYWFGRICKSRLREKGIKSGDVMKEAAEKVEQRLKIEEDEERIQKRITQCQARLNEIAIQLKSRDTIEVYELGLEQLQLMEEIQKLKPPVEDADINNQLAKLTELHSQFHVRIEHIYPEGYAGLHPLIAAAFMAKAGNVESNATQQEVKDWAVNFVLGYLEMVAQNAVSLARNYQLKQGSAHVIFSGQLVGRQTPHGTICRAFMRKYVRRLFRVEPLATEDFGAIQRAPLGNMRGMLDQMNYPVPDLGDDDGQKPADVLVWFHATDMPDSTWQKIQLMSRRHGTGMPALGDSIKKVEISSTRCCVPEGRFTLRSFVFASIGTGSPIAKVTLGEDGALRSVDKIGGSAIGGGTSVGLLKAAFPAGTNFDDQVARPLTEFSWQIIQMVARTVAEIVSLLAILHDVDTVVFTGGFLQNNPEAESWMVNVCLELGLKVLFQKPDKRGFTAVVGAHYLSGGASEGRDLFAQLVPGHDTLPTAQLERVPSPEFSRNGA